MLKIIAKGKKDGHDITVIYENGDIFFKGGYDPLWETDIAFELSQTHEVGGTYYPPVSDPLNIIEVFKTYFFDKPIIDVQVECDTDYGVPSYEEIKDIVY